ncbi:hypothetical protein [Stenotrophomonas sp.]|uniref:hypothetical protein n=1 Tax=Stenotrophomonas sp. TaxID=69392 RepID=UPI0028AA4E4F|nr:hypothetical protein [Stenotrophomonas sp.]
MSPNSRLPNKARASDLARMAICLALIFITATITFIVFREFLKDASDSGLERRKEVAADDVQRVRIPGMGVVDYQRLFEVVSEPGESLDAFVLRIGPRLRAYSDAMGFEACGVLATDGERFSVVVGTNFGYMACVSSSQFVLEGFRHAGATIHSHGKQGRFHPTKTDLLLMGETFAGGRPSLAVVHGQALNAFSDADRRSGAGYLAGEDGRVFFQGNGTTREVE